MNKKIVVMDSGIGGATILKEIINLLPNFEYLYFADTKFAPYGNRTKQEITEIVVKNVLKINKNSEIVMLVLACNTASSACSEELRKIFNFPIVCVEPPIKLALDLGYKNLLILATPQTLKTNQTIKSYIKSAPKNVKIKKLALADLAKRIDETAPNFDKLLPYLNKNLGKKRCDCVLLGCTHYNFLKKQIQSCLPTCRIISCEKQVALQAVRIATKNNLQNKKTKLKIKLSKQNKKIYRFLKTYLSLRTATKTAQKPN